MPDKDVRRPLWARNREALEGLGVEGFGARRRKRAALGPRAERARRGEVEVVGKKSLFLLLYFFTPYPRSGEPKR